MDKKLPDVKSVYSYIVDSVIANARAHFLQDGVDECAAPLRSLAVRRILSHSHVVILVVALCWHFEQLDSKIVL